jgi:Tfp pilus assembly protein PilF
LIAADRLAEAEAALRRAIEAMPQVAEFQLGMAALLETQGQAAKAEQLLREMVNRHPKLPQARRSLADFLMLHDRPAEAEVQFIAAVKLQRPDAKVLRAYAAALSKQGKNAEAIRQLEAALNLEPKHAQTNFELAELLSQQGRNREAIARYSQALEADPKNLSALNNLAWLLATHPDPEIRNGPRAVELAERACQLTEWKTAFLMGTLAAAYAEAGRFADAVATAERARDRARADNLEDVAKTNERLLELYRGGQPFRDTGGTEKAEP